MLPWFDQVKGQKMNLGSLRLVERVKKLKSHIVLDIWIRYGSYGEIIKLVWLNKELKYDTFWHPMTWIAIHYTSSRISISIAPSCGHSRVSVNGGLLFTGHIRFKELVTTYKSDYTWSIARVRHALLLIIIPVTTLTRC